MPNDIEKEIKEEVPSEEKEGGFKVMSPEEVEKTEAGWQETQQELKKEGYEKDIQFLEDSKEKISPPLEPEVLDRAKEGLDEKWGIEEESGEVKEKIFKEIPFDKESFYSIEREKNEEDFVYKVFLKNKEGKVLLDLQKEFLSENYRIVLSPVWRYREGVFVGIPIEKWSDPKEIIMFAHEAGHTNVSEQFSVSELSDGMIDRVDLAEMNNLKKRILSADKKGEKYLLEVAIRQWGERRSIYDKALEVEKKIEQLASDWALEKIDEIKRTKNIDLLKPFKDSQEVKDYINKGLASYEEMAAKLRELMK